MGTVKLEIFRNFLRTYPKQLLSLVNAAANPAFARAGHDLLLRIVPDRHEKEKSGVLYMNSQKNKWMLFH